MYASHRVRLGQAERKWQEADETITQLVIPFPSKSTVMQPLLLEWYFIAYWTAAHNLDI
jgi:hypothetical protein